MHDIGETNFKLPTSAYVVNRSRTCEPRICATWWQWSAMSGLCGRSQTPAALERHAVLDRVNTLRFAPALAGACGGVDAVSARRRNAFAASGTTARTGRFMTLNRDPALR